VVTAYLQEEIDSATDRYFSPQIRQELVELIKDSALSILAREGEARALEIAAVMKAILACGLITDPPREVPFLRGFFEKAVSMMIAQGGGRLKLPVPTAPLGAEAMAEPDGEATEAAAEAPSDDPGAEATPEDGEEPTG
jgi:hypothetical protein